MEEKKLILIVEDERGMREALKSSLADCGFGIDVAEDGEEALEKIIKLKPDLVLLDIILPKKDGFEILEQMKNNPLAKDIPVVVTTNLEESKDVQRALELGAKNYLVKSNYTLDEIASKVKKILSK